MAEHWTAWECNDGTGYMAVAGRVRISWLKKIQPWWWFMNDEEPLPPGWYKPDSAEWLRFALWYVRNPLMNFGNYVLGVQDRNYSVIGKSPVGVTDRADIGETGWQWSYIRLRWVRLPYISYTGKRILWHVGWMPGGNLSCRVTILGLGESVA